MAFNREVLKQSIVQEGVEPSREEVDRVISASVSKTISSSKGRIGLLLSGGVDSALLLKYVLRHGRVPVFTVVTDLSHPDLAAAQKVAKKYGLEHHVLIPSKEDLDRASRELEGRETVSKGDAAVYLALELARDKGVDTVLTADGIDELTGGYWWHANVGDRFTNREDAFDYYWSNLESEHISPLLSSAEKVGIKVELPFLDRRVVSTLSRISIEKRVEEGIPKKWWKDFSRSYVPSEIVDRPKIGFVDSLDEEITAGFPTTIWWEADYQKSEVLSRRPRKVGKTSTTRLGTSQLLCKEVRLPK